MEILVTHIIMKICDNRMKEYFYRKEKGSNYEKICSNLLFGSQ
jgi:hypothetical protein